MNTLFFEVTPVAVSSKTIPAVAMITLQTTVFLPKTELLSQGLLSKD